jgi:hypothetical protein
LIVDRLLEEITLDKLTRISDALEEIGCLKVNLGAKFWFLWEHFMATAMYYPSFPERSLRSEAMEEFQM